MLSSAHAISQTKELLNTLEDKQLTIEAQNKIVATYIANSRNSQDGIEGVNAFFEKRKRKGFTEFESVQIMRERNHFGAMMVELGEADAMISGLTRNYRDVVRPAIQTIGTQKDVNTVAGLYILMTKRGPLFLADTTINMDPTAEEIAEKLQIALNFKGRTHGRERIMELGLENRKVAETILTIYNHIIARL
jgi:phosphotransacetylase